MRIAGTGTDTYLYLNGLTVPRPIRLGEAVTLLPATPSLNDAVTSAKMESELDLGLAILCLRHVASQIHVTAADSEALARLAWCTLWDVSLLSAVLSCNVGCNLQSDAPVEKLSKSHALYGVNSHLVGLALSPDRSLSEDEAVWLEANFASGRTLLQNPRFSVAVEAMCAYHFTPSDRVRLGVLWSGIEGLFGVESELSFRVSLYAARFLAPDDPSARRALFSSTRRMYSRRSAAVHGASLPKDGDNTVEEARGLLHRLIRQCVEAGAVPSPEALAP